MKGSIRDYVRGLVTEGANVYTVMTFLVALGSFALPLQLSTRVASFGMWAALSLLIASFNLWRDAVEKLPGPAELSLRLGQAEMGAGSSTGGIPHSPFVFRFPLDVINRGEEDAALLTIEITAFEIEAPFLTQTARSGALYQDLPAGRRLLQLPLRIPGRERKDGLLYCIGMEIRERDPLRFAQAIRSAKGYHLGLRFVYENMERTQSAEEVRIDGTFDSYREDLIDSWRQSRLLDLVVEALGV